MRRGLAWAVGGALILLAAAWAGAQPREGEAFPALAIKAPTKASESKYLGLAPGAKSFRLDQVKAQAALVEVFSMYCPICQAEAPRMNEVYAMIQARGLGEKLKVLGLGAGNSDYEVGVFRAKFKAPFPLLPDADFTLHKGLGEPRTPLLLLVKISGGKAQVVYAHLGPLGEPKAFLDTLLAKAGIN